MVDANHRKDVISGALFLILGVSVYLTLPLTIPQQDTLTQMGPQMFPSFVSISMAVLGAILIVVSIVSGRSVPRGSGNASSNSKQYQLSNLLRPVLFFAIMTGSTFLLRVSNYFLAVTVGITLMLALFRTTKVLYYGICIGFSVAVYYLFSRLMYVSI